MRRCEECENRIFYINTLESKNKSMLNTLINLYIALPKVEETENIQKILVHEIEKATGQTIEEVIK